MKTCNKCKKTLPKADFYKNKRNADGLMRVCRVCHDLWIKTTKTKGAISTSRVLRIPAPPNADITPHIFIFPSKK